MSQSQTYRGGRVTDEPTEPQRMRYPCMARQCMMPGSIFPAGAKEGVCAWHYGTNASDWPRITQILLDWGCVAYEINEARRVFTDPETRCAPKVLDQLYKTAWERLQPLVPGWEDALAPGKTKAGFAESYGDWARRLEKFLGTQVHASISARRAA